MGGYIQAGNLMIARKKCEKENARVERLIERQFTENVAIQNACREQQRMRVMSTCCAKTN